MKKLLLILLCLPLLFACNSNNRKVPIEMEKYYQLIGGDYEISKWIVESTASKAYGNGTFILTNYYSVFLKLCPEQRTYSLLFYDRNGDITKQSAYGHFWIYDNGGLRISYTIEKEYSTKNQCWERSDYWYSIPRHPNVLNNRTNNFIILEDGESEDLVWEVDTVTENILHLFSSDDMREIRNLSGSRIEMIQTLSNRIDANRTTTLDSWLGEDCLDVPASLHELYGN